MKKWRTRFRSILNQPEALQKACVGLSRAPKNPPTKLDSLVEETLLNIRENPPEGLRRTPGPKAIQYYLKRDETLQALGLAGSRSTRTIYEVLVKHERIVPRRPPEPEPMERASTNDTLPNGLQSGNDHSRRPRWEAVRHAMSQSRGYGFISDPWLQLFEHRSPAL